MKSSQSGKYAASSRTTSTPASRNGQATQTTGSSQKSPKRNRKKATQRKLLLALIIVATISLATVALFAIFVKPPKIEDPDEVPNALKPTEDGAPDLHPADAAKRKQEYFTFVLGGVDEDKTRTDTLMVVAYDVKNGHINVVNVPRDTLVESPYKIKKINSMYTGGIEDTKDTITDLLGIPIDRYAVIDFDGFEELVEAIGGVYFDVPVRMKYDDPTQNLHIDLQPGPQQLNGKQALHFVRFRKMNAGVKGGYPNGDLDRIKAQQEFIKAVIKQMASPANILKINDIAKVAEKNLKTDLSITEMVWFAMRAVKLNTENITMEMLPGESEYLYEPAFGQYQSYFVADYDATLTFVNEKLNPYLNPITKLKHRDVSQYSTKKSSSGSSSGSNNNSSGNSSTAKPETKPEPKPETKPETKPDTTPDTKPETKPDPTPTPDPEPTPTPDPTPNPDTAGDIVTDPD